MELKEKIKKMIIKKNIFIDSFSLKYFVNYFYVAIIKKVIPDDVNLEELIENIAKYKIIFYDENSDIYKKYGSDVKGLRDAINNRIYIRYNLNDMLKEITIYHEIHHVVQTNYQTNNVGLNQDENKCRMIMEAQTQYFAEEVFKTIYGIDFPFKKVSSENVRLYKGGCVLSNLHNYELYDCMLSKLAIILGVSKDFFVSINYYFKNEKGLDILREKYNESKKQYSLSFTFEEALFMLDRIYVTDLFLYSNEAKEVKETLLNGQIIEVELYKGVFTKISKKTEWEDINRFDTELFLDLEQNSDKAREYALYIISNSKRKTAYDYLKLIEQSQNNSESSRE